MAKSQTDGLSAADRNKRVRQEALRDQLSNQKLVEKVIDISNKLNDLDSEIDSNSVTRLKYAADINLKLINKYLPDMKDVEMNHGIQSDNPIADLLKQISGRTLDPNG